MSRIRGLQTRDEVQQPQQDVIRDLGKVLCRSGMGVSALIPVFLEEGPEYFGAVLIIFSTSFLGYLFLSWGEILRNLLPSSMIILFAVACWYPFQGVTMDFILYRIPWLLTLASIVAVEYDRFRIKAPPTRQSPLLPISNGRISDDRPGSPQPSSVDEQVLQWMGAHLEVPSLIGAQSDISLSSDELSGCNVDLEADPRGRQWHL